MSVSRSLVCLTVVLAAAVSGCGNAQKHLLTPKQAAKLLASLRAADRAATNKQCSTARRAAEQGASRASALSDNVDRQLRANLVDGFNHLVDRINSDCAKPEKTPTPTPEPTPTPTSTPSPTPTPTPSPTPTPTPSP